MTRVAVLLASLCVAACSSAAPPMTPAGPPVVVESGPSEYVVPVEPPAPTVGPGEAAEVTFPANGLQLHGFLYRPDGPGPFPAIVYNHGSERTPGKKGILGRWFTAQGFVFFFPNRRGHGASPGEYIGDSHRVVSGLEEQVTDVLAAIRYVRAQPFVVPYQVAVAGCSYGGIETLLTAERPDSGVYAAVDFAGASMSWSGNGSLRERLIRAARNVQVPIFFLQAQNDFNTTPTLVLSDEAGAAGRPFRARIFPPHGIEHMEGHAGFCNRGTEEWGPEVLDFLRSNMRRAP